MKMATEEKFKREAIGGKLSQTERDAAGERIGRQNTAIMQILANVSFLSRRGFARNITV